MTISEEQAVDDNKLQRKRNRQIEKRDKVISGIEKFWGIYAEKLANQYQQFGNAGNSAQNTLAYFHDYISSYSGSSLLLPSSITLKNNFT